MKSRARKESGAHRAVPRRERPTARKDDRSAVCGISSSAMLCEAANRMKASGTDRLSVLENREIVGTITNRDIAEVVATGLSPTTTPVKYAMTLARRTA